MFALSREAGSYKDAVTIEVEGQVGQHLKGKTHLEFNIALVLRWLRPPWGNYVDTSLSIGNGLSSATRDPEFELETIDEHTTNQVLYYLMLEGSHQLSE